MNREDEEDYLEEEDLKRTIDPRVDTSTEFLLAITKPTVRQKYAKYVSRDLSVSNIPKSKLEYVDLVRRYISIINDFIFLDLKDMADVYNADLKALLNVLRSIDGFERKQQGTITRLKGLTAGESGGTGRWGLKK